MKRFFTLILAVLMFCTCLTLASCGKTEIITPAETKSPIGALTYKSTTPFTHRALTISYPTGWTETRGDYDTAYDHKTGNSVSIEYIDGELFPENITDTEIEAFFIADYREMYVTVESISTSHITNKNGLEAVRFTMTNYSEIYQLRYSLTGLYIKHAGRSYLVCITENVPDKRLYTTVFDSLSLDDSYDYESNPVIYTNVYMGDGFTFEYPEDMYYSGNTIHNSRAFKYIYVYYPEDLYIDPEEEESDEAETNNLVYESTNEHYILVNENGVTFDKWTATATSGEYTIYFTYLQFAVNGEPYLIEIEELTPESTVFDTVFASLNITE